MAGGVAVRIGMISNQGMNEGPFEWLSFIVGNGKSQGGGVKNHDGVGFEDFNKIEYFVVNREISRVQIIQKRFKIHSGGCLVSPSDMIQELKASLIERLVSEFPYSIQEIDGIGLDSQEMQEE